MKKSICVIDDDEIYQKIIQKLIPRTGIFESSFFFMNAQEALEEFNSKQKELPSILLLDINMPVMDGWQFLEQMQEFFPNLYLHTKVYIVTSSIAYSDKDKMQEFPGVSGFLSKPMKVEKLKEIGDNIA